jgi:hypothetical protein
MVYKVLAAGVDKNPENPARPRIVVQEEATRVAPLRAGVDPTPEQIEDSAEKARNLLSSIKSSKKNNRGSYPNLKLPDGVLVEDYESLLDTLENEGYDLRQKGKFYDTVARAIRGRMKSLKKRINAASQKSNSQALADAVEQIAEPAMSQQQWLLISDGKTPEELVVIRETFGLPENFGDDLEGQR